MGWHDDVAPMTIIALQRRRRIWPSSCCFGLVGLAMILPRPTMSAAAAAKMTAFLAPFPSPFLPYYLTNDDHDRCRGKNRWDRVPTARSWNNKPFGHHFPTWYRPIHVQPTSGASSFVSRSGNASSLPSPSPPPRKIAIVGGGLAGLSTLYHLIELSDSAADGGGVSPSLEVDILDPCPVGTGGASSVAGGLLHPLSPRGKLVHWGLEGLEASNRLIQAAAKVQSGVVLRNGILRLATSESQSHTLRDMAHQFPSWAEWIDKNAAAPDSSSFGALRMHGWCQVLHVPTYLQGLWKVCGEKPAVARTRWIQTVLNPHTLEASLREYDTVVLAAGAGMIQNHLINVPKTQLVRGQSILMQLDGSSSSSSSSTVVVPTLKDALLCGKYVSPTPHPNQILIGATHEFTPERWSEDRVYEELRSRTTEVALSHGTMAQLWETGTVQQVTQGMRVQSARGKYGRLPIIGRWNPHDPAADVDPGTAVAAPPSLWHHPNLWIFTGLSSRGLLYHGLFGQLLADAILRDSQDTLRSASPNLLWWQD